MAGMRPTQRLADLLYVVLLGLGVLNFFSPLVGIPRDPLLTYALVGLAGVVFGFGQVGGKSAPRRRREDAENDQMGDSEDR